MIKKILTGLVCLLAWPAAAAGAYNTADAGDFLTVAEHTVTIPGLTKEYEILFLADMHILVQNDEVGEDYRQTVEERQALFTDANGTPSAELWPKMAKQLDSFGADAVLLGGDMIDFASEGTFACLKDGLDTLETPYLYARADHDYGVWYETMEKKQARNLHKELDGNPRVSSMDMGEFLIVSVSNNTSQISEKALGQIEELFSAGKPIVLMLHVPLQSLLDDELDKKSKEVWQDRSLLWGKDTYYEPNENTQAFLDLVYGQDSPVREILCGHLHFLYDGYVTETVHQHVVNPAYTGEVTLVHIRGEE